MYTGKKNGPPLVGRAKAANYAEAWRLRTFIAV